MLSMIASMFGGQIIEKIFGTIGDVISKFQQKQITEIEAKQAIQTALITAMRDVEVAHADLIAKTYSTFMGVVEKDQLVATVWAIASISQLAVLLWHQIGIPMMVYGYHQWWDDPTFKYPSSGTTVEWAYALLGGLLGLGALALRGTAVSSVADRFKSIIK